MVFSSWGSPPPGAPPQTSPQQLPWKFRLKPRNTSQPASQPWAEPSAELTANPLSQSLSLGSAFLMPTKWSDIQGLYLLVVSGWFICLQRAGLSLIKGRQNGKWSHRRPEKREGEKADISECPQEPLGVCYIHSTSLLPQALAGEHCCHLQKEKRRCRKAR